MLQSHAHLALTFVCMVGVVAAIEAASQFTGWVDQLIDGFAVVVLIATGLWAMRRYLWLLNHAESVANQADCPCCGTYARFRLVQADALDERARVCCRQCGHHWTIEG